MSFWKKEKSQQQQNKKANIKIILRAVKRTLDLLHQCTPVWKVNLT